jgi:hypothetical protein
MRFIAASPIIFLYPRAAMNRGSTHPRRTAAIYRGSIYRGSIYRGSIHPGSIYPGSFNPIQLPHILLCHNTAYTDNNVIRPFPLPSTFDSWQNMQANTALNPCEKQGMITASPDLTLLPFALTKGSITSVQFNPVICI